MLLLAFSSCGQKDITTLIVGSYTDASHSNGINVYNINFENRKVEQLQSMDNTPNASFLAFDNSKKTLFCVHESKQGSISSFRLNGNQWTLLNTINLGEDDPCHIGVYDNNLFISNYGSGSFSKVSFDKTGRLEHIEGTYKRQGRGFDTIRQNTPHAHSFYPSSRHQTLAYAADLGTDKIITYDISKKFLRPIDSVSVADGAGVRHLAIHPEEPWLYAINELNSTITLFSIDSKGKLAPQNTVKTTITDVTSYCAEVQIHPNGKMLYASNRGENTISAFDINPTNGQLHLRSSTSTEGNWPRYFMITQDGKHLIVANQKSNNIVIFPIKKSGDLESPIISFGVNAPSCILER